MIDATRFGTQYVGIITHPPIQVVGLTTAVQRVVAASRGDCIVSDTTRDIVGADIQALLFAGTAIDAAPLQRSLADREETIVPLVTERQDGGYDLYRLVAEKVVSINTTAAGGNASLMSL